MYETVFTNFLFPAYERIHGRRTHRYLAEYEQSQWWTPEAIAKLQLSKLNALLDHSWQHVPFLQRYWRDHSLRPRPLESVQELAGYPVLTKQLIKENYQDMVAAPLRGRTLSKTTGGSTGDPFKLEYTVESYERRGAMAWRGSRWAGVGLGTRTAYLWGRPPKHSLRQMRKDDFFHRMFNRLPLDAFSIRDDNVDEYIAAMQRHESKVIVAYVAPLLVIARRMNQTAQRVESVKSVMTGAEALHAPERAEIEQAFRCRVFNTYGCREVMLIAAECSEHDGMHISADHLVVETADADGVPVVGESGDVLLTDLHNYGMPFVRYRNGDRATLVGGRTCKCGRGLPLLANVDGRVLDLIITADGRNVPGEFFIFVMLGFPHIRQFQFVQTAKDRLEIRIVPGNTPLTAEDKLRLAEKTRDGVGAAMQIDVREVTHIPPAKSGKRRLSVSLQTYMTDSAQKRTASALAQGGAR